MVTKSPLSKPSWPCRGLEGGLENSLLGGCHGADPMLLHAGDLSTSQALGTPGPSQKQVQSTHTEQKTGMYLA